MNSEHKNTVSIAIILLILIGILGFILAQGNPAEAPIGGDEPGQTGDKDIFDFDSILNSKSIKKGFESEQEFKDYLAEISTSSFGYGRGIAEMAMDDSAVPMVAEEFAKNLDSTQTGGSADRVSGTNVQVLGIDEPDIVKTDGKNIFYSDYFYTPYLRAGMDVFSEISAGIEVDMPVAKMIAPDYYPGINEGLTKIISAFPVDKLSLASEIKKGGELFFGDETLVVLSGNSVSGFDVSDASAPEESWTKTLEDNHYIVDSRLYEGDLYLVTARYINRESPCNITPLAGITVPCGDIYHPVNPIYVDTAYTVLKFNIKTGELTDRVSFVGSSGYTTIYASGDNLYATYSVEPKIFPIISKFFTGELRGIVSDSLIGKIEKLGSYDIGEQAKLTELYTLIDSYRYGLSSDESLRISSEIQNKGVEYFQKNMREFAGKTGIMKIAVKSLDPFASGEVDGRLLNQFSLDEYNGYLRVATTIEGYVPWFGFDFNSSELKSTNEVFVLDKNLKTSGKVENLGIDERIYSVRFLGDKGYVVTFRETDPFYVLDLSNPKNPVMRGQLKIPGYSSYLHPIENGKILGVGREGSSVKISLFDVKNPSDPKEISKYTLNEYWSDVLNTHHAFLLDDKHKVFFMPGGNGAYILSYANDTLSLKKAVSEINPRRAVYLNDYLYIISQNKVIVLDENTWERVKELSL